MTLVFYQVNEFDIDCLDLLQKTLCLDPRKRIAIEQVMLHPWLAPA